MSEPFFAKDVFLWSIERCLASESFVPDFYKRFLAQSPSVRNKFRNTDMQAQAEKLGRTLRILASAVAGDPDALRHLAERAESHSRYRLNITPDMYELWTAAILATAREHDYAWTDEVEAAWTHTLKIVVDFMIARA